jgi:hypothetical protein
MTLKLSKTVGQADNFRDGYHTAPLTLQGLKSWGRLLNHAGQLSTPPFPTSLSTNTDAFLAERLRFKLSRVPDSGSKSSRLYVEDRKTQDSCK